MVERFTIIIATSRQLMTPDCNLVIVTYRMHMMQAYAIKLDSKMHGFYNFI